MSLSRDNTKNPVVKFLVLFAFTPWLGVVLLVAQGNSLRDSGHMAGLMTLFLSPFLAFIVAVFAYNEGRMENKNCKNNVNVSVDRISR